jgi:hypothetical protein
MQISIQKSFARFQLACRFLFSLRYKLYFYIRVSTFIWSFELSFLCAGARIFIYVLILMIYEAFDDKYRYQLINIWRGGRKID